MVRPTDPGSSPGGEETRRTTVGTGLSGTLPEGRGRAPGRAGVDDSTSEVPEEACAQSRLESRGVRTRGDPSGGVPEGF